MQQFPLTGNPAHDAVFAHVSPESTWRIVSDEAQVYLDQVAASQQAARQDPYLNGQDALRRLRRS
jgi:hypothetical protein